MENLAVLRNVELTNQGASPKLEVKGIFMPDPSTENRSSVGVVDRPGERAVSPGRERARELVRAARETGKVPMMGGAQDLTVDSRQIKEAVKEKAREIDPLTFDDPVLRNIAETLKRAEDTFITAGALEDFGEVVVARAAMEGVQPEQAIKLRLLIKDFIKDINISEGRVQRGESAQEAKVRYSIKTKTENERRISQLEGRASRSPAEEVELTQRRNFRIQLEMGQKQGMQDLVVSLDLQGGNLDESTIQLIATDADALEYLINRLVAIPLDNEMGVYSLGFWGQNNLESIKTYLKTRSDVEDDPEITQRYRKLLIVSDSIQMFHQMNKLIVTGNLDGFTRGAEEITPEKLQVMQGVNGSGVVMRLFDQEYEYLLSRDGWINNDNYGKMMGFVIEDVPGPDGKTTQRVVKSFDGSVFSKFKKMVIDAREAKRAASERWFEAVQRGEPQAEIDRLQSIAENAESNSLANMADWEISWAYNVGKILHNLSLRPAEYISQGENPPGAEQYASFPQEGMARLMNWMNEMMIRFQVAEVRGGLHLSKDVQRIYNEDRHHHGYHKPKIKQIMGKELAWFELPGVFEVSGPMSSWRQTLIILRQVPYDESIKDALHISRVIAPEREKLTIGHLVDTDLIKFNFGKGEVGWDKLSGPQKANYLRTIFLDNGHLRQEINTSLGVLLKNGALAPSGSGHAEYEEAKRQIRIAIWERVAEDNPLAILPYLNGLVFDRNQDGVVEVSDVNGHRKSDTEDKNDDTNYTVDIFGAKGEAKRLEVDQEAFYKKLFTLNEIRMERIARGKTHANPRGGNVKLKDLIDEKAGGVTFTDQEKLLLTFITRVVSGKNEQGIRIGNSAAHELADVRFNFNPFMNDVLFEQIVYGQAGAEFYRRRAAGDLGSMFKALQGFIGLAGNPNISVEEAQKLIHEITEGIGSPLSTETGQKKAGVVLEAYLNHTTAGENDFLSIFGLKLKEHKKINAVVNNRGVKGLRKLPYVAWAMEKLNKPNSWAQQYSGSVHAPAYNYQQIEEAIHHFAEKGTINHHIAMELRKKKSGKGRWKLFAWILAGLVPLGVIGSGIDLTRNSMQADEFKG